MNLKIRKKTITIDAPIWRRVLALLIDYVIVSAFILFPFHKLKDKLFAMNGIGTDISSLLNAFSNQDIVVPVLWISIFIGVMMVLYFSIIEAKYNQSIGKIVMNIYVIDNSKKIQPFPFKKSLLRSISLLLDVVFLFDIVYAALNPKKQRFFEKISSTRTVMVTQI